MTVDCWEVLALAPGSDERTIKRRYAQLLKVTRPDEDPVAFQRLREVYEQALQWVPDVPPALVAVSSVPVNEILPQEQSADEAWLNHAFVEVTAEQLDTLLASARVRGCQGPFEHLLLRHCLADTSKATALTDWAMERLQWLTPWQGTTLPQAQMEVLIGRLLIRRSAALVALLEDQRRDEALLGLKQLLDSPWLQNVDRREWARRQLLDWLIDEPQCTPQILEVLDGDQLWDADDVYVDRSDPLRIKLARYREELLLVQRWQRHLAVPWPRSREARQTWMLLKDLSPAQGRRLADQLNDDDWLACAELDALLRGDYAHRLAGLSAIGIRDWRQWLVSAEGAKLNLLLMTLFAGGALLYQLLNAGYGTVEVGNTLLMSAAIGLFGVLMVQGAGMALEQISQPLTVPDVWLSSRVLPANLFNKGAGFLLLRHGLPCALIGVVVSALAVYYLGAMGATVGVLAAGAATVYTIHNLRRSRAQQMAGLAKPRAISLELRKQIGVTLLSVGLAMVLVVTLGKLREMHQPGAEEVEKGRCAHLEGPAFRRCELQRVKGD